MADFLDLQPGWAYTDGLKAKLQQAIAERDTALKEMSRLACECGRLQSFLRAALDELAKANVFVSPSWYEAARAATDESGNA